INEATFVVSVCAITGSIVPPAFAFECYQDKKMGDLDFNVVQRYADKADVLKQFGEAKREMDAYLRDKRLTSGEVVQCVDYFLFPEKILVRISKPSSEFLEPLRADCSKEGIAFFQATHANHAHFQQDLLTSLDLWHRMAISLGRDGNYGAGLWMNAISDHYLHDMFAPGHIATPRDRM